MEIISCLSSSFSLYPVDLFFGMLWCDENDGYAIAHQSPINEEWGRSRLSYLSIEDNNRIPYYLDVVFLSILEKKFYSLEYELPYEYIEEQLNREDENGSKLFNTFIVGFTPYGGIALWLAGEMKEVLVGWQKGEEIDVTMDEFCPYEPSMSLDEYCSSNVNESIKQNIDKNGLPPVDFFDGYMKQYFYRYSVTFEMWDGKNEKGEWKEYDDPGKKPIFDWIKETLYDGTFDMLRDKGLMLYHNAGKPQKLAIRFQQGKKEYNAFLWFCYDSIKHVFDKFYGAHPETKADFIIKVDAENKKYELALYRQGLKEPVVIPESAYQLIVFKNKFEDYRSENFDQPRGAWIW